MKSWWKWLLGVFFSIIVIIFCGTWYLTKNWKPIIESKLKEVIINASDSLYTLHYTDMDVNFSFGNIALDSVALIPDTAVYQKLVKLKKAPNNIYNIQLNALRIKHFSITDILFNKKLNISSVVFDGPNIHMTHEYHAYNDTVSTEPPKNLYDHIKSIFKSINVNKVTIDDADFKYSKVEGQVTKVTAIKGLNINIKDILIDSLAALDSSRLFYTKDIDVQLSNYEYNLPDGFYKVAFDNLHINTRNKSLSIKNVVYKPRMNKNDFFRRKKENTTMSAINFDLVQLNGLDFKRMVDYQQVFGSNAKISNGLASFSEDMRYPRFPKNKIGHAPYQQLMKVKSIFHFNTVFVDNVTVSYDDFSAKYDKLGVITFNNATGVLTNVTNDRLLLQHNKMMHADLTAKVMNAGKLHIKFGFDMLSKNGSYTYVGSLTPMKAADFNRILTPLVNVQIASGNIKGISFNMKATDYKNWGTFKFDYDSLHVNILGKPKDGKEAGTKKTITYIINKVLINQSNPDSKGVYHVGAVEYTRVPEYSFFKTMWQSLLVGIVQCAGISAKTEATIMGAAEKSGKVLSTMGSMVKGTEKAAVAVGRGVGKAGKAVGKEAGTLGKEIGKEAGKVAHGTDSLFKRIFKKKNKEIEE